MQMGQTASNILIAGDFCAHGLWEKLSHGARAALAPLRDILSDAELRIINLENAVIENAGARAIAKRGPALYALPENLAFLEEGRFGCAVLANNHVGDFGEEGVLSTMRALDSRGIARVGAGANIEDSYQPAYFSLRAGTAAVIAVCENEFGTAKPGKAGTAGFALGRVIDAIVCARKNADFVIVVMHGGNEYNPLPSPRVVERYRSFVEFGAHAVVGMHPHRVQGYEIHKGAPILYSTGNFFFQDTGIEDPGDPWYAGYLAKLALSKENGVGFELIPYRFDPACTRITPLAGRAKADMLAYLSRVSEPIRDPEALRRYFLGWLYLLN